MATWNGTSANQSPAFSAIQDAINTGVFTLKSGGTVPSNTNDPSPTSEQILNWISVTISSGNQTTQLPQKQWIQASLPPGFTVTVHNETAGVRIDQVHGTAGYIAPFTYPMAPGNTQTDPNWPVSMWAASAGIFTTRISGATAYYHIEVYYNNIFQEASDSGYAVPVGSGWHFAMGTNAPPVGTNVDVYMRDGMY